MHKDSQYFERLIAVADLREMEQLGSQIASGLQPGDCVALEGDLGSGKTTLARAILRSLGVSEAVPSPTFTLVQTYETESLPVRHYDFYRIGDEREIEELGFDEALAVGAALVEWPERAGERLPGDMLRVGLAIVRGNARSVTLSGPARWALHFGKLGTHAD
jgi:hypothetical protein